MWTEKNGKKERNKINLKKHDVADRVAPAAETTTGAPRARAFSPR
jgi:hypothetical protein